MKINADKLRSDIKNNLLAHGIPASLINLNLFSPTYAMLSKLDIQKMGAVIAAIEAIVVMPAYQEKVLQWSPTIAQKNHGTKGVFYGYDFHLSPSGPQLIEINTNAGGVLLNLILLQALLQELPGLKSSVNAADLEVDIVNMFINEWRLQRSDKALKTIAIVDHNPEQQHLYSEFVLFKNLFKKHGFNCVIADPAEFTIKKQVLYCGNFSVDLVYNRLTDFYFMEPQHAILAEAYTNNLAVFTPHPYGYALYANKRNLTLLTDEALLRAWHVPEKNIQILINGIPRTRLVGEIDSIILKEERKHLFFKPVTGYGGKGTYRGESVTKRVFEEILHHDYVAQNFAPASYVSTEEGEIFKIDLRNYVYEGKVQLLAARLYQGQTTNFRTPGGGFAGVFQAGK